MSAIDLFCSEKDWSNKILYSKKWFLDTDKTVETFVVPSLSQSVGFKVGDEESPVVFGGFKVDPIAGNVALSVCLGSKWCPVARRIHQKFVEAARKKLTEASSLVFPSPLIDSEYADLILTDTRQPLSLLDAERKPLQWADLRAGDRITATVHFGGFVSNSAVTHMFFSCSSIQRL